jgi:hypothetical protein
MREHGVNIVFRERGPHWLRPIMTNRFLQGIDAIQEVDNYGYPVEDATFRQIMKFSEVEAIVATDSRITDLGLAQITMLPNLTYLELDRTAISNSGLTAVRQCRELTMLRFSGTAISDEGLTNLYDLKKLRQVVLFDTRVTAEGLDSLQAALPETPILADPDLWHSK